jgi:hypothetical protein
MIILIILMMIIMTSVLNLLRYTKLFYKSYINPVTSSNLNFFVITELSNMRLLILMISFLSLSIHSLLKPSPLKTVIKRYRLHTHATPNPFNSLLMENKKTQFIFVGGKGWIA